DYPRQNLQQLQPLQPTQSMQQQNQVQTHGYGSCQNPSALPIPSTFSSTAPSPYHAKQHNYYPVQPMTIGNPDGRPYQELPPNWTYGCCGISNETWTNVILYALIGLSFIDTMRNIKDFASLMKTSDNDFLLVWAMFLIARGILLFVASIYALIHIQQRKTAGFSFLRRVLILCFMLECAALAFNAIQIVSFVHVFLSIPFDKMDDRVVFSINGLDARVALPITVIYYCFVLIGNIISLILIHVIWKVLFDFRATMRQQGAY
ncbi:hypothetical protein PFISCL1PPCAC_24533, partial [Pristionchus fissidentatus]